MPMEKMFFLHSADGCEDLPEKVYIEPTSLCNMNCSICFRHNWAAGQLGEMSRETFEKLREQISSMPYVRAVFFGGMGEPLLHGEICGMVESISKGKHVSMLTNGTMLTAECSYALIAAGLSELWVSMDGFDQKSYEAIQIGSRFVQILKNLRDFNAARDGTNVKLGITFVVTPENAEQLNSIDRFADEIRADILNISHIIPNAPVTRKNTLYGRDDIPVGRMKRFSDPYKENGSHICPFISGRSTFVRWDGEVVPCMQLLHDCETYLFEEKRTITSYSYGNVLSETLLEIWRNTRYSAFRQRVHTFYFPFCDICWGCEDLKHNQTDCFLGEAPTCGACLWPTGKIFCP